jgi:hypothetical protein
MKHQKNKTIDHIIQHQQVTLLELLDRLLDKGVVVKGELLLSVADVDLLYLNLGVLLSSVKTVREAARSHSNGEATLISWQPSPEGEHLDAAQMEAGGKDVAREHSQSNIGEIGETIATILPSAIDDGLGQLFEPKANIDPKNVEKGLAKLVLTLVDLIRKLMEKQAIRRIEAGQLHAGEIEGLGNTFLLLDERMEQLKKTFGLENEDLNIDLGPLGDLV